MDLRDWIAQEHSGIAARVDSAIGAVVPQDRWKDRAQGDGNSIAALLFHFTLHADYAMACVIDEAPLASTWRQRLGIADFGEHCGLAEAEDVDLTAALDVAALYGYHRAVWVDATSRLEALDHSTFGTVVAPDRLASVAGVDATKVPWLISMWTGKPVSWFIQWELIGHGQGHLGEMVSVRSRLGLSPF